MKKTIFMAFIMLSFFIDSPIRAQVTIGSDIEPNRGALLDLKELASTNLTNSTKGINFPRVALQASDRLEPCATTNATTRPAHKGLVVYHTDNAVMNEGLYYWNGTSWRRLIDELPPVVDNSLNLQSLRINSTTEEGAATGERGSVLDFGALSIPENGAYAFNFRLYGSISGLISSIPTRCIYYISVWVGNDMRDIAEMNIYAHRDSGTLYTYSVALGANFIAGENVTFKISHHLSTLYPWTLISKPTISAARTTMIWWKL